MRTLKSMRVGAVACGVVGAFIALATGCQGKSEDSSSSSTGPGGVIVDRPDQTEEATAAFQPLIEEICSWQFGCCTEGQRAISIGSAAEDRDECVSRFLEMASAGNFYSYSYGSGVSWVPQFFVYLGYDLDLGRVEVDEDGLEACRAALEKRDCAPAPSDGEHCTPRSSESFPECETRNVLKGKQKQGQPCSSVGGGVECEPGLICSQYGQEGVCIEGLGEGSACRDDYQCPSGLLCSYESGTCEQGGKEGDACSFFDPDRPELGTEKQRCAAGLLCDPRSEKCAPQNCTYGTSCSSERDCPEGLPCVIGQCRELSKLDQPCYNDEHCAEGRCDTSYSICVPLAPEGVSCNDHNDCTSDFCDNGMCAKRKANGKACVQDDECVGYCDFEQVSPVCAAYVAPGGACTQTNQCGPWQDATCLERKCRALPRTVGQTCTEDYQCESEVCNEDGMCEARGSEGADCSVDMYNACDEHLYCKTDAGEVEGKCSPKKNPGEECVHDGECPQYNCRLVEGRRRCGETASATEAMCDGTD